MVKGRMQSSFRILPEGNGYLLAMASELLDAQLADLKKYAVFSKATLTDESAAGHASACKAAMRRCRRWGSMCLQQLAAPCATTG